METILRDLGARSLSSISIKASFTPLSSFTGARSSGVVTLEKLLSALDDQSSVDELRNTGCARAVVAVLFVTMMQKDPIRSNRADHIIQRSGIEKDREKGNNVIMERSNDDYDDYDDDENVECNNDLQNGRNASTAVQLAARSYLRLLLRLPSTYDLMVLGVALRRLGCNSANLPKYRNQESIDAWGDLPQILEKIPLGKMHPESVCIIADLIAKSLISSNDACRDQSAEILLTLANDKLHGNPGKLASALARSLVQVIVCPKLPQNTQKDLLNIVYRVVQLDKKSSSTALEEFRHDPMDDDDEKGSAEGHVKTPGALKAKCNQIATLTLLENCSIRVPSSAKNRVSVSRVILEIIRSLESEDYKIFEKFLRKQACHPRAAVRVFAVELALQLILDTPHSSKLLLTEILISRANDRIPTVRAKALSSIAQAFASLDSLQEHIVDQLSSENPILKGRTYDAKSGVRKAATQLLGAVLTAVVSGLLLGTSHNEVLLDLLELLSSRCRDRVTGVRRAAVAALAEVCSRALELPRDKAEPYLRTWMSSVLPRVRDSERAVQEASVESFSSIVFETIRKNDHVDTSTFLLEALRVGQSSSGRYASHATSILASQSGIEISIVKALQDRCFGEQKEGRDSSWALLSNIVISSKDRKIRNVIKGLEVTNAALRGKGGASSSRIAAIIAKDLPPEKRGELSGKTFTILSNFQIESFQSISALVLVLASLDSSCGGLLLKRCENAFLTIGLNFKDCTRKLLAVLTTLGETVNAFALKTVPSEQLVTYVKALTDPSHPEEVRASALVALGKLCMCEARPLRSDQSASTRTASLKLAFGELLARHCISLFVSELSYSEGTVATVLNSIIVLGELCRRYTSVVEPYTAQLATCLRHDSIMIRRQTLTTINSLIQEDYLKLRSGSLFFRLSFSLLDQDKKTVSLARYCFMEIHNKRNPHLFSLNFVELIYVLNDCQVHKSFNQFKKSPREELFLKDTTCDNRKARESLYSFFLANIPEESRVGIPARVRNDILGPVAEAKFDLGSSGVSGIVADSLHLLATPELRADGRLSGPEQDAIIENDIGDGESVQNGARKAAKKIKNQFLSEISETELKEGTIPVLVELRKHLEKNRSPLLSDVSQCLSQILIPYQDELESILDGHKNLCEEVAYDIKSKQNQVNHTATSRRTTTSESLGLSD